ncbi:site-specific DNA-methyltransferase [Nocardioides sp. YIM B13467]|uniref:site-specific DNA-methyltransferase n=1 Tax=Nocardioides sp. YIM B13467 TaxID=3366294 RepID=UPI0036725B7F
MSPRKGSAPKAPIKVESIHHGDKRPNLPTPDAAEVWGVPPEVEERRQILVDRDISLDPQLVWKGKYGDESLPEIDDAASLEADAPPIYIQEKIDPRVLIEDLRRTAAVPADEPELTLFDSFDGLDELDRVEFYAHQANWSNRMILGDSLQVMGSLAEREELRGQVQMIYLDPPYGIKFGSNWQASARKRDVKDGKLEDAAREAEQIKAFRDTWELGIHSYLSYLRDRLLVARELLTESGSCFVQIGDENVHLVRSLMDEVFGSENFVSQVAFNTTSGAGSFAGGTNVLASIADYILWFAKDLQSVKYRQIYSTKTAGQAGASKYSTVEEADGSRRPITREERESGVVAGRLMVDDNLTSQTTRVGQTTVFPVEADGRSFVPGTGGWKTNRAGMDRLVAARRVTPAGRTLRYVRYFDDFAATPLANVWSDIGGVQSRADPKIYVVQTSATAIQRCVLMCTDPGDLVLDPTCGSGTTAYVAEQWGRRWITVDTSRVALALARQRLMGAKYPMYLLADSEKGRQAEAKATGKPLPPAPTGDDIRHGFVYERVQHITLKSIANNPDIREGMSRGEVDAAIKRHADFELLYDKPYEDKQAVRVAGPFTVESLNPHRSLAFSGTPESTETISEQTGVEQPSGATYERSMLDNLRKAGIQTGKKSERIEFVSLDDYPGRFIQAVGETNAGLRVGIAIGPEYGTVDQYFAKTAAHEAILAENIDLVCVLAFAFDARTGVVTEVSADEAAEAAEDADVARVAGERRLGKIRLLFVRMNSDLLMGEELKKTGAGNLFTVFGEPDIDLHTLEDGRFVVELNGVDVYDPTTNEVRSNDTSQIALWMIDTDYNGESFFVRHCYFTGGKDPYERLKRSLKAEIDIDAWATLNGTTSRPFDAPDAGKIAVKVINDYGDEVMKIFEVPGSEHDE